MEEGYLIKFKRPENDFYEYKCKIGGYTPNIKDALIYPPNSPEMYGASFGIRWLHPDWNVEIIDRINEIGTYISTYDQRYKFKHISNTIRYKFKHIATTILCIILIPILIPITWIMELKDKIIQHFNN